MRIRENHNNNHMVNKRRRFATDVDDDRGRIYIEEAKFVKVIE